MRRITISARTVPDPAATYSHAVKFGSLLFVSGQFGLDKDTGTIATNDLEEQMRVTMNNLGAILEAGGSSFDCVLKVSAFLNDMAYFPRFDAIYGTYFRDGLPARTTVQAGVLAPGALVEIDAIAYCPSETLR